MLQIPCVIKKSLHCTKNIYLPCCQSVKLEIFEQTLKATSGSQPTYVQLKPLKLLQMIKLPRVLAKS